MKTKRAFHFILFTLVAVLLVGGLFVSMNAHLLPAQAQSGPEVRVIRDRLGQDEVSVALSGTNLSNLGGFEFDLDVNPSVAQVTGARLGAFLGSSGRTVGSLGPIVEGSGGSIAFGGYSYDPSGNNGPGATGEGVLAYVTMTVQGEGVSDLALRNGLFGDVEANEEQVSLQGAAMQVKRLHAGWNLVAPCVQTSEMNVPDAMTSVSGGYGMVIGEEGTYVVGLPDMFQTLKNLQASRGYYVRIDSGQDERWVMVARSYQPTNPITLTTGWHWIGYCVDTPQSVSEALASINGKYEMVIGERGTYVVGLPDMFQTLQDLRQGEGYLVRMSGDGVLAYPSGSGNPRRPASSAISSSAQTEGHCQVQNTPYMTLMYGEVRIKGEPAPEGTVVEAVTPRGEVAGCFEVHTAGYFGVMQVYGADDAGDIPGFRDGEAITWRVNGQEAEMTPRLTWRDDKAVHEVVLEVKGVAEKEGKHLFVPWLSK